MRFLLDLRTTSFWLLGTATLLFCVVGCYPAFAIGQETQTATLEVMAASETSPVAVNDLSISPIGSLGGLVGITDRCDSFSEWWSMVIGACAGALVVAGVRLLDHLQINEVVDAWPVRQLAGFIPNSQPAAKTKSRWVQFVGFGNSPRSNGPGSWPRCVSESKSLSARESGPKKYHPACS